jgi:hypothetical protein
MNDATIQNFLDNIRALAQRDGAVEIRAERTPDGGVGTTCKTRVLEVIGDGELLVDVPPYPEANEELARGADVSVLAVQGSRRLIGYGRVLGVEKYELAGGQRTRALRISRATAVESAQRRRFFRASAGGAVAHPVELYLLNPATDDREPIEPKPLKAWLLNIGGGGVGVTAEHGSTVGPSLRRTTRFLALVKLPGEDQPLQVVLKLVHLQAMHGDTLYLGFEFQFDRTAEQRRVEDQIVRVTTLLQRQQIRRQRGA